MHIKMHSWQQQYEFERMFCPIFRPSPNIADHRRVNIIIIVLDHYTISRIIADASAIASSRLPRSRAARGPASGRTRRVAGVGFIDGVMVCGGLRAPAG